MRALIVLVVIAATAPFLPGPAATALRPSASADTAEIVRWVDGDTVETTAGTVRLIGVDTPERGRCGYVKAGNRARRLAPAGTTVRLANPTSVDDADKYGRLLRYVLRGSVDVGRAQIRAGAKARYDSRDGYDRHPRQRTYRRADARHRDYCGKSKPSGGSVDKRSYPPIPGTWNCPAKARIKGNRGSSDWIYHMPHQDYYDVTNPEECFASRAGAERAGYRASKV